MMNQTIRLHWHFHCNRVACRGPNLYKTAAMRLTIIAIPVLLLTLTACSPSRTSMTEQNDNPLTASRYGEELADTMANFIITDDPIIDDPTMRTIIEREIERGKDIAAEARKRQNEGFMGPIITIKTEAFGYVLYVDDTLYLSSDFAMKPGPAPHVYITTVVDPRDGAFPDATAIDLGPLQAAYGPQKYVVPKQKEAGKLRTFVLYDTELHLINGFAQLSRTY